MVVGVGVIPTERSDRWGYRSIILAALVACPLLTTPVDSFATSCVLGARNQNIAALFNNLCENTVQDPTYREVEASVELGAIVMLPPLTNGTPSAAAYAEKQVEASSEGAPIEIVPQI